MISHLSSRYRNHTAFLLLVCFCAETAVANASLALRETGRPYPALQTKQAAFHFPSFSSRAVKAPEQKEKTPVPAISAFRTSRQKETHKTGIGGPGQPEMQAFTSVGNSNMVDLYSGDFSYNVPLMDVGGYPISLGYRSGISMDQEASWVGLGWNVNPGTITRNLRGIPDDFNGSDSITKTSNIRQNKTVGVTGGLDLELTGLPLKIGASLSLGVFKNTYRGWGLETGLNASINAGVGNAGLLTSGLSLTNNSQEGLTIAPSLSLRLAAAGCDEQSGTLGTFSVSAPYNTRSGIRGLQLGLGLKQYGMNQKDQLVENSGSFSSFISFNSPAAVPTITMPLTASQYTFTAKVGSEAMVLHPSVFLSGYVSKQYIDAADQTQSLPAFGYLHQEDGVKNPMALLDFNREKEMVYRDKPAVPNIAIPFYTYDAFSMTGEGTGGMFRAYRGDIGYVYDHFVKTRDHSLAGSIDIGLGDLVHWGLDVNLTRSFTQNVAWLGENRMIPAIAPAPGDSLHEAAYFRNPGEKTVNDKAYYDRLGGDDLVSVNLSQSGSSIQANNLLNRYKAGKLVGTKLVTRDSTLKKSRDKRNQVISYLNAGEASVAGLSKYIENYPLNQFTTSSCTTGTTENPGTVGTGLQAEYYNSTDLTGTPFAIKGQNIDYDWGKGAPGNLPGLRSDNFTARWSGRIKAPVNGIYVFEAKYDDGCRIWINDSCVLNTWRIHNSGDDKFSLKLEAGKFYTLRVEYYEDAGQAFMHLLWALPGTTAQVAIPTENLYPAAVDSILLPAVTLENRVNAFRKKNHISEIDVVNNDGKRYVYGIPVYNFRQKEATFAIAGKTYGSTALGLSRYSNGIDNSVQNPNGKDSYFSSQEMPAYAHSFLLTGILSPDYVDVTGNGISDDDLGDAIKFDYSRVAGYRNRFSWRAPAAQDSVNFNEGLKTDSSDDKGSYVYGEKELWYLHTIESKNMIATFTVEDRNDVPGVAENGAKSNAHVSKRLKQIDLYTKTDLMKNGVKAIPIKTVHFEYSYDLCPGVNQPVNSGGKLTLKKVWFAYNGNAKDTQNAYVFHYHANNPGYAINQYDRWGNYKNPLQNPGSTATHLITNADYPYALQDSTQAGYNAAAWTLDSVRLPSGGGIKVDYESDDYAFVQNRRAMQMFKILGFSPDSGGVSHAVSSLYSRGATPNTFQDNLYVYIKVPTTETSRSEVFSKYLSGVNKIYFRVFVQMPTDGFGSGSEYIPCYADLDPGRYGFIGSNTIWVKMKGISLAGDADGSYSPVAKAAIQFLRLNLPSKAYPGSDVGGDLDADVAVKMIYALGDNIKSAFKSFDMTARNRLWCTTIDTSRSFVRLDNPYYQKFGGGLRVKRITISDNWNAMTGSTGAVYGQEYNYTCQKDIDGKARTISSGVAVYEPTLGGEENPFRQPIEYAERISPLGPTTLGYSEEPYGESIFPAATVGYSRVRVRTINRKNTRSANGFEETQFYTAYDFPTQVEHTDLDPDSKKRYKPALSNFLRINAKYYLNMSQGFKVELNDMAGKLRSQGSYAETDSITPITYTEYVYKVSNPQLDKKTLANTVTAIAPDGSVDTAALIGKDAELMMDMREQYSVTNGANFGINSETFSLPGVPPFFLIPSLIGMAQSQITRFRSAAVLKVIQRYGIVDSVIHIDKGSKVTTKDLAYDAETGDAILTRTNNEFNDPVYTLNYPSHWAYDGLGPAYKNINLTLSNVTIRSGKIIARGAATQPDSVLFAAGDEILVAGRTRLNQSAACGGLDTIASFPQSTMIWAIDTLAWGGGSHSFYFIDKDGKPYSGDSVTLKVVRSGRRNISGSVGSVTSLVSPLSQSTLKIDTGSRVIASGVQEYKQLWKVADRKVQGITTQVHCDTTACNDTIPASYQSSTVTVCYAPGGDSHYCDSGAWVFPNLVRSDSVQVPDINTGFWSNPFHDLTHGRLNQCGVWPCGGCVGSQCSPGTTWLGFSNQVYIPTQDTVFVGIAGDNQVRMSIDSTQFVTVLEPGPGDTGPLIRWRVYPVSLKPGYHNFTVQGWNENNSTPASFGMEIYNMSRAEMYAADSNFIKSRTIYSTKQMADNQTTDSAGWSCPMNYSFVMVGGHGKCTRAKKCVTCDSVRAFSCYSPVTDTTLNAYRTGILGNFRPVEAYTYYGTRTETDPTAQTDIRNNGVVANFSPFWKFQGGKLKPQYDSTRWVWNNQSSLFNQKGYELENFDALNRYNTGLYGFLNALPTAVVQNSRYRESAYEGFEDYGYTTTSCDTTCPSARHFDFSFYLAKLTTQQKHTGKYSLKLNGHDTVALSSTVVDTATDNAAYSFTTTTGSCLSATTLAGVRTNSKILHPLFSPFKSGKMLVSVWVKESIDCNTSTFSRSKLSLLFNDGASTLVSFVPTGTIVEGWQRIEGIFTIPATATTMTTRLIATDTATVYFDDLRIMPFNASMKSFVYNPTNLRLMAELDENNYASFYEYDDDGTLIRTKKETERGIQTIKETRSALHK